MTTSEMTARLSKLDGGDEIRVGEHLVACLRLRSGKLRYVLYSGTGTWVAPMGVYRLFQVFRFFGISEASK
jgi:hypothetical protein